MNATASELFAIALIVFGFASCHAVDVAPDIIRANNGTECKCEGKP